MVKLNQTPTTASEQTSQQQSELPRRSNTRLQQELTDLQQRASEAETLRQEVETLRGENQSLRATNERLVIASRQLEKKIEDVNRELVSVVKQAQDASESQQSANTLPKATEAAPHPLIGTFVTRPGSRHRSSQKMTFTNPHGAPPGLPIGLTMLDMANKANIRVTSYPSNVNTDRFEINVDSCPGTKLHGAACTWLEITADHPDFQFGKFSTVENHPWERAGASNKQQVTFRRPYSSPPQVVVWLTAFDLHPGKTWRVMTYASDITTAGFTIHIDTWRDSVLFSAVASWVAYTTGKPGVSSGRFSTLDVHPASSPQPYNTGYVAFPAGAFSGAPRVLMAINSLDIDYQHYLRLQSKPSAITAAGMLWHLNAWLETTLYSAGGSYIALS